MSAVKGFPKKKLNPDDWIVRRPDPFLAGLNVFAMAP